MIDNLVTHEILPMRTAAEQFELVGAKSALLTYNVGLGLYYISSGLGACVMVKKEWNEYLRLCGLWTALPLDLEGAPGISMLEATADEEAELDALRLRQPSGFARSFREIEECLLAHARCLSDEERDEIIRQIGSKVLPLKEAVLRAEEIWIEGDCNERDELIKAVREIETLRARVHEQGVEIEALRARVHEQGVEIERLEKGGSA